VFSGTIAYLLGLLALYQLPQLPEPTLQLLLWLASLLLWSLPRCRRPGLWLLLFAFGFSWAALDARQRLTPALQPALEGIPIEVTGVVDALPQRKGRILRFVLAVEQASQLDGEAVQLPRRLRLAWYEGHPQTLAPGQRWQLRLKLKRPWSMRNPGGFDYEAWLFREGIGATGYVRSGGTNRMLDRVVGGYSMMRLRHSLEQAIAAALDGHPMRGMVTALAIGERSAISDAQWEVLLASGTNHLVAISGLHVGLVAGLVFLLARVCWRRCPLCCLLLPAPRAASLLALLAALGYAALAGFSLPTQRALLMLGIVLGALWWQRPVARARVLLLALWVVLLVAPVSVLSAGFWLSFAAVSWILYGMSGRVRMAGLWWRWGRVQLLVAAGLLPLLLLFFQQGSLSSPLANLVAVPWVSLLVVPLTLSGVLVLGIIPAVGGALLGLAATLLEWMWPLLQWISAMIPVLPLAVSVWALVPAIIGLLWLFAPHGWPLRPAGVLLLLPLLSWRAEPPAPGTARFTLLDVGQGLAAVVQTQHHVLLYDTGPRYPSGFDTGDAVVVPFLREAGIRRIDTLVVSHAGNDHAGGARSVLQAIPAERVLSSIPPDDGRFAHEPCVRGQGWHWDGVEFRILHPADTTLSGEKNDHSCVLWVRAGEQVLLLTADIEAPAEEALLRSGQPLQAELLVAPHHGSKTSSTLGFVEAVAPQAVLFAVGYRNRYGFPHAEVVERYRRIGSAMYHTDRSGALRFSLGGAQLRPLAFRRERQRIWHSR